MALYKIKWEEHREVEKRFDNANQAWKWFMDNQGMLTSTDLSSSEMYDTEVRKAAE